VHDKDAAVKYFAWDGQWISYDDGDTFKEKIAWADDVGFTGSLLWASNLDYYTFTAHKNFTGIKNIGSALSRTQDQIPSVAEVDVSFGANCYREHSWAARTCQPGYKRVGYDRGGMSCPSPVVSAFSRTPATAVRVQCFH
jgi:chitinase